MEEARVVEEVESEVESKAESEESDRELWEEAEVEEVETGEGE